MVPPPPPPLSSHHHLHHVVPPHSAVVVEGAATQPTSTRGMVGYHNKPPPPPPPPRGFNTNNSAGMLYPHSSSGSSSNNSGSYGPPSYHHHPHHPPHHHHHYSHLPPSSYPPPPPPPPRVNGGGVMHMAATAAVGPRPPPQQNPTMSEEPPSLLPDSVKHPKKERMMAPTTATTQEVSPLFHDPPSTSGNGSNGMNLPTAAAELHPSHPPFHQQQQHQKMQQQLFVENDHPSSAAVTPATGVPTNKNVVAATVPRGMAPMAPRPPPLSHHHQRLTAAPPPMHPHPYSSLQQQQPSHAPRPQQHHHHPTYNHHHPQYPTYNTFPPHHAHHPRSLPPPPPHQYHHTTAPPPHPPPHHLFPPYPHTVGPNGNSSSATTAYDMYRSSSSETALALPAAVEKGDKSPVPPPQETYHQKQGAANQVVLVNDDEDMGAAPTTDDFDPVPVATTAGGDEQTMVDRDSPPHIVSQCNSHDDGAFMMTNVDTAAEDVTAMSRRCVQFLDLEAGLERKRLSSSQEGGMDEHSQLGETESQSNVQNATTTVNDNSSKVVPVDSDDDGDIPITIEKAVQNSMASSSSSSKSSSRPAAMMSPITMCFERMLGAAEYIKTPGVVESKKRGPFNKKVLPLSTNTSSVNIRAKRNSCSNGDLNAFEELLEDPDLERLVILQMAMQRNQIHPMIGNTGGESSFDLLQQQSQLPKRDVSPIITEGFFWREYPACEQVLYNHMHRYYEISAIQKNYKVQQFFNNVLVEEVRKAAIDTGFTVDPEFCDKKLRDRIRCFYKTHLQNAKKRLATLQKHSDSIENQTLVAVFIQCVRNPKLTFEEAYTLKTGLSASTAKISLSCDEGQIHNSSISYGAVVPDQENSRHSTSNAVLVAAAAPGAVPKKRRLDDNDKPPLPPTMMMYHHHNILSQPRHHHLPRVDGSGGNPSFHSHHHPTVYSHPDASRPCDAATLNIMSSHACYSPPMDAPPTATVPVYHHHFPPPPPQP